MTLRIGVHPSNPTLDAFSRRPELQQPLLDAGIDYRLLRHPDGVETVPLFRAGAIDVAGTGFTPPLTVLDAGTDVVYLATSRPRREPGGLAVRADSGITEVAQLRGRTVALALGSWQTASLAFTLEAAGLNWDDVVPLSLGRAAAHQAFVAGDLDAWILDEPVLSRVRADVDVRVLTPTADVLSHPSVFFGTRRVSEEHADALRVLLEALDATDAWISAHPDEAATVLAGTTREPQEVLGTLTSRPWGLHLPSADFRDESQRAADLLAKFGVLTAAPDVAAAIPASPPFTPSAG
jgi:sulfonate transport system substrate-binding protein